MHSVKYTKKMLQLSSMHTNKNTRTFKIYSFHMLSQCHIKKKI